jgi:hypothetical protein
VSLPIFRLTNCNRDWLIPPEAEANILNTVKRKENEQISTGCLHDLSPIFIRVATKNVFSDPSPISGFVPLTHRIHLQR